MSYITYDLGTGGVKASLYDENILPLAKSFIEYPTIIPKDYMHEQKPMDWWHSVVKSTHFLLQTSGTVPSKISCLALSGQSCVAIPLDHKLNLIDENTPIWSDTRATKEVTDFFSRISKEEWYMATGNGFPASCYSLFKLMYLKNHEPEKFARIWKVAGSKDFINLKMTGRLFTDYSYASSTGAYDLRKMSMREDYLEAAGIPASLYPDIISSHTIIGTLTPEAAEELGLPATVKVACGGVDNACMALGAVGTTEGAAYCSLGSSSWLPVNSHKPVLDFQTKPYVFAHLEDGMFTSAYSIFAGGSSNQWSRNQLCRDLNEENAYQKMDQMAAQVPIGSGGVLFNPSLAGGTSQDKSMNIRGAFLGLHLGTSREAMVRAVLEGIALNLKSALLLLTQKIPLSNQLLFCGGGSKSLFWMQMFADVFDMEIIKTNIDQDAASLGAAAVCARATGIWKNYEGIPSLHQIVHTSTPEPKVVEAYKKIYRKFVIASEMLSDLGDIMANK